MIMTDLEKDLMTPMSFSDDKPGTDEGGDADLAASLALEQTRSHIFALRREIAEKEDAWSQERAVLLGSIVRRDAALGAKARALQTSELQRNKLKANMKARYKELAFLTRRAMSYEDRLDQALETISRLEGELQAIRSGRVQRIAIVFARARRKTKAFFRRLFSRKPSAVPASHDHAPDAAIDQDGA